MSYYTEEIRHGDYRNRRVSPVGQSLAEFIAGSPYNRNMRRSNIARVQGQLLMTGEGDWGWADYTMEDEPK